MKTITTSLIALALVACHRAPARFGTTTTTAASLPPERMILNDDAAMIMTKARCRREAQCDDLGPGGRFGNHEACLLGLMPQESTVVRDEVCPAGVDERRLSACVDALLQQSCGVSRAGASEPASCQAALLCGPPAAP